MSFFLPTIEENPTKKKSSFLSQALLYAFYLFLFIFAFLFLVLDRTIHLTKSYSVK